MKTIYRLFLIVAFVGFLNQLEAQNVIRPKIKCPNNIWVNSYNGVLFYQRPDVSIKNGNLQLEAVFYYNSSSNAKNYGYGKGWSLGTEMRLITRDDGIIVERGDGRSDLYSKNGNGYKSPAGVFDTLIKNNDEYVVRTKDGTQYIFNDTLLKKITQLKDRYGNYINYTYTDSLLSSMSDRNGRSINLAWSDTLMTGITTSFDDRTWGYLYDSNGNLTQVIDPMGGTSFYGYNDENRITSFTDAKGYTTYITYNKQKAVSRVKTDLTDKSIKYEQDDNKTVIIDYLSDGNSQFSTYVWDEKGRVIEKIGNCCGLSSKLQYDDDDNVIKQVDANGNVTRYTYDEFGNVLTMTDALGNVETFTYEPVFFNLTSYSDKKNNQYFFNYDDYGNLINVMDPLNQNYSYSYNQLGQITSFIDANSNTTSYSYDVYGNMISETNALGNTYSYAYSESGYITEFTTPRSHTTHYSLNNRGDIIRIIDPLGHITQMQYDNVGNIVSIIDPMNNAIELSYNALKLPLAVTGPMNNTFTYSYNAKLKTVQVTDAMQNTIKMFYDDHDRMMMSIDEENDTTWYSYDNVGNMIGVELPNGHMIDYQYDALNRLVSISDQLGTIILYVYDANDNIIQTTDGNGNSKFFEYDAVNNMINSIDPLGYMETYTYDANGNILTFTDKNNRTTIYTYNAIDMLLTETDALGNTTTYEYDTNGNVSSVSDPQGNVTSYVYDFNDKLTQITFANGKTQKFWYDANGNIIKYKDEADNNTIYQYDANDNLTKKIYPDNTADSFTYDLNGNMLSAINNVANVLFTYDHTGKILTESLNGKMTSYSYDSKHGIVDITYPSGRAVRECYDKRYRLTEIIENSITLAAFSYNDNNMISQRVYKNGISATYSYDQNNRLIQLVDNPNVLSYIMTYDNYGNMITKKDMLNSNTSESFEYDDINQLIDYKKGYMDGVQISNPLNSIQYIYDVLGNRTSVTDNNIITSYISDNMNRYTLITGGLEMTPHYDMKGNMIQDETHNYQYNYNNRIISVDNGNVASYKYDALNRRIQKESFVNDQHIVINYYYAGDRIIEERNNNDIVDATYVYGISIDDILQMNRNDEEFYYHKNHIGTVMALTTTNGEVVERYNYNPYGTLTVYDNNTNLIARSSVGNTVYFTGRDYDIETDSYYYRARTMSPLLGRFMQNDPLLYIDGMNMYKYVDNMPIMMIDPSGMDYVSEVLGGRYGDEASRFYSDNIARDGYDLFDPRGVPDRVGLILSSLWNSETASSTLNVLLLPIGGWLSAALNSTSTFANAYMDDCASLENALIRGLVSGLFSKVSGNNSERIAKLNNGYFKRFAMDYINIFANDYANNITQQGLSGKEKIDFSVSTVDILSPALSSLNGINETQKALKKQQRKEARQRSDVRQKAKKNIRKIKQQSRAKNRNIR